MAKGRVIEELRNMTKEERLAFLEKNRKVRLNSTDLDSVSGGIDYEEVPHGNPNSDCPDEYGSWESSFSFICNNETPCY